MYHVSGWKPYLGKTKSSPRSKLHIGLLFAPDIDTAKIAFGKMFGDKTIVVGVRGITPDEEKIVESGNYPEW